jgi:hypothetical protein
MFTVSMYIYVHFTVGMTTQTAAVMTRTLLMQMMMIVAVQLLLVLQARRRELSQQMVSVAVAAVLRGLLHDSRKLLTVLKQQGVCTHM